MKNFLKLSDVAEQLLVSPVTVRKYCNEGKIQYDLTPSGQRVFRQEYVNDFLGITSEPVNVFYVRSSDGDKTKIANQVDLLTESFGEATRIYKDTGSGLNENRGGLKQLMRDARKGEFNTLIVTQKDRLTRLGYSYLEEFFSDHNVSIRILGEEKQKTLQEELLQDFMSLIASFSGKFYRLRGYEQQKTLLNKAEDILNEKTQSTH